MVGGIERFVSELFQRTDIETTAVAPAWPGDNATDAALGYRVHRFPFPAVLQSGKRSLAPLAVVGLAAAMRCRPTIVCCDQLQTTAVGIPLARVLGVPHLVFAHGMELTPRRLRRFKQWALDRTTHVVSNSRFTATRLRELYAVEPERVTMVHPGVDVERFTPAPRLPRAPQDGPVLLTLGRLDPSQSYKGYDRVLRAVAALRNDFPGVRLIVAGRGDDQSRLERLAQELGISGRVRFAGFIPDTALPAAYREADVFVLPSGSPDADAMDVEGYGIVFAEAAASGLPCVAYRLGGVTDPVIDGETGFLTAPEEPAFQSALRRLLADEALRARMGAAARAHAERALAWRASVDNFTGLLARLHASRAPVPLRS